MRRASRAFASLFDKGRGLMVPRGNGGQVRVLTLVAMCIYFVCVVLELRLRTTTVVTTHRFPKLRTVSTKSADPWLSQVLHREYDKGCFVIFACMCCMCCCIRL
jgi:hypothetical protein